MYTFSSRTFAYIHLHHVFFCKCLAQTWFRFKVPVYVWVPASLTSTICALYHLQMFDVIDALLDSDSDVEAAVSASLATSAPEPTASSLGASSSSVTAPQGARSDGALVQIADGSGAGAAMVAASVGLTSGPSATPSDVVVIDDNDIGGDAITVRTHTARRFSAKEYWINKIGYPMQKAVDDASRHGNSIEWHLPPRRASLVEWCVGHIDEVLHDAYVAAFYIGITHVISERWLHPRDRMRGHCRRGFQRMVICAVSDQSDEIANAETSVIARFRRFGRGGQLHNTDGHPLCENRNPGGEGAHHGTPPFCLYVCWKWNRRSGN